jgi:hypothetical protein
VPIPPPVTPACSRCVRTDLVSRPVAACSPSGMGPKHSVLSRIHGQTKDAKSAEACRDQIMEAECPHPAKTFHPTRGEGTPPPAAPTKSPSSKCLMGFFVASPRGLARPDGLRALPSVLRTARSAPQKRGLHKPLRGSKSAPQTTKNKAPPSTKAERCLKLASPRGGVPVAYFDPLQRREN